MPSRSRQRATVEHLCPVRACVQCYVLPAAVWDRAVSGRAAVQSDGQAGGDRPCRLQRRGQLHDQYQLAVLQRRSHDEPLHPDDRAGRAELRLRVRRHVRAGGPDQRSGPQTGEHARQLLGRPRPHRVAHHVSAVVRGGDPVGQPGRDPEPAWFHRRQHAGGRPPAHSRRAGGQPGRDQAARHQRRRVLQRELRASVRKLHADRQFRRKLGDPDHPVRAVLRLRQDGARPSSRLGGAGHHGHHLDRNVSRGNVIRGQGQPAGWMRWG